MNDNQYMSKEELASTIWEVAKKLRGKIDASVYKNIILGFVFYKFVSENEYNYYLSNGFKEEEIKTFNENDIDLDLINDVKENLGYFISYEDMFRSWVKNDSFSLSNVITALNAFDRLINDNSKVTFSDIFKSLNDSLGKIGGTPQEKNNLLMEIINLINRIPVDKSQGYDTLGYIYEYLINQFAAGAKKAGEFYTPHEASMIMSEIISNHLKDREHIEIYDPTSGSASLLLNIGESISKNMQDKNKVKYYAQELIDDTFTLTRMNLIMKGIIPENIIVRCADTLGEDWPLVKSGGGYEPLLVDAVVSNPPYSQPWKPEEREGDPRFSSYGYAPRSKADYAFLLHDLYHLDPNGIMTIVLPHGVLFRGKAGEDEYEIRKKLIEENRIDAIIGLPSNIFYGTGIPTIIMVLKKQTKTDSDVLIIDASKGYEKRGNKNKLRDKDIRKIVDTVISRTSINRYSKLVSRQEIINNDYNLNIPRYVDSKNFERENDIYATMYGGIPNKEIEDLNEYWKIFKDLKKDLFENLNSEYSKFTTLNIREFVLKHKDIKEFKNNYNNSYIGFDGYLKSELIDDIFSVDKYSEERELTNNIYTRIKNIQLVDYYDVYQLFMNKWSQISQDIETIKTNGFEEARKKIQVYELDKNSDKITYVPKGFKNNLFEIQFIQNAFFKEEVEECKSLEYKVNQIDEQIKNNLDNLSLEAKENDYYIAEENKEPKFDDKLLKIAVNEIYENIENEELKILRKYIRLCDLKSPKSEKLDFISKNKIDWNNIQQSKDGTYSKNEIKKHILQIQKEWQFEDGTDEYILTNSLKLKEEKKTINKELKEIKEKLEIETWDKISSLNDDEIKKLLYDKWINSLQIELSRLPEEIIDEFIRKLINLNKKYDETFIELENSIAKTENIISSMIEELNGNEFDLKGLNELKSLFNGGKYNG